MCLLSRAVTTTCRKMPGPFPQLFGVEIRGGATNGANMRRSPLFCGTNNSGDFVEGFVCYENPSDPQIFKEL